MFGTETGCRNVRHSDPQLLEILSHNLTTRPIRPAIVAQHNVDVLPLIDYVVYKYVL
jgi:hypothetical protein